MVVEADWMKQELKELRDSINNLSDHRSIIHTIEKYLWTKFDGSCLTNESVMYVANKIFFSDEDISISELVRKAGYSHKHFLSLFKSQVGTSPKNLQRIVRLQRVIQIAKESHQESYQNTLILLNIYDHMF